MFLLASIIKSKKEKKIEMKKEKKMGIGMWLKWNYKSMIKCESSSKSLELDGGAILKL